MCLCVSVSRKCFEGGDKPCRLGSKPPKGKHSGLACNLQLFNSRADQLPSLAVERCGERAVPVYHPTWTTWGQLYGIATRATAPVHLIWVHACALLGKLAKSLPQISTMVVCGACVASFGLYCTWPEAKEGQLSPQNARRPRAKSVGLFRVGRFV